ncbi:MAG: hypothetical protein ABIE94_04820 [archaeon]
MKDINDLLEHLSAMEPAVFYHHCNEQRNDFHNWIRDVFDEKRLANSIKCLDTKEKVMKQLFHHVFSY